MSKRGRERVQMAIGSFGFAISRLRLAALGLDEFGQLKIPIHMIETDQQAALFRKRDQGASHIGWDVLTVLVKRDVSLANGQRISDLCLSDAELCADGFQCIHERIISPTNRSCQQSDCL